MADRIEDGGKVEQGHGLEESPCVPDAEGVVEVDACVGTSDHVRLAARTPNAEILEGNVLTVRDWSGGALFQPRDERNARLIVSILDPLNTHPFYIGIAPANANLVQVNAFQASGIFLCLGGGASHDLMSALGAPGGPAFQAFGERSSADLPSPLPGQTLTVHYWETGQGDRACVDCHVRFALGDDRGEEMVEVRPPLRRRMPACHWRPCLLLCVPGTRIGIKQLL
mmetsp:Transcript_43194/g.108537  ORF Transcript_43194/g.108537 Transcript_43194/m.108537 type:complete len:226 (+) Transcript_43194:668-1345(+)